MSRIGHRLWAWRTTGPWACTWPDALEAFTGTRQMDGGAMVRYFQPLMTWMEEQNRDQACGW
jgi:peptidyl-dipeptidase A